MLRVLQRIASGIGGGISAFADLGGHCAGLGFRLDAQRVLVPVGPRVQSQPDFQENVLEPRVLHVHLAADVFVGPSHLVGRTSDAPQRHGGEERFHHPAADVFSNVANSLADVFSVFALDDRDANLPQRDRAGNLCFHRLDSRPAEAQRPHARGARRSTPGERLSPRRHRTVGRRLSHAEFHDVRIAVLVRCARPALRCGLVSNRCCI